MKGKEEREEEKEGKRGREIESVSDLNFLHSDSLEEKKMDRLE